MSETSQYFDGLADGYEERTIAGGYRTNEMFGRLLGELIGEGYGLRRALDLGAGTGMTTDEMLRRAEPDCVVAVDFSGKMLNELAKKYVGDERVVLIEAAVEDYLQAADEASFDLVAAISTLPFLSEPSGAVRGIARCLRPGGAAILNYELRIMGAATDDKSPRRVEHPNTTGHAMLHLQSPGEIHEMITGSGLRVVGSEIFPVFLDKEPPVVSGMVVAAKPKAY